MASINVTDVNIFITAFKLLEIIDVNLAKLSNLDYTIVKEDKGSLENLLYLFASNDKEKIKYGRAGRTCLDDVFDILYRIFAYRNHRGAGAYLLRTGFNRNGSKRRRGVFGVARRRTYGVFVVQFQPRENHDGRYRQPCARQCGRDGCGFSEKSFFDTHIGHNVRGVVHISNCAGNVFQTHEKARIFNGAVPSSSGKEGHTRMEYRLPICRDNDAVYRT